MEKITMLGVAKSGKTCFLYAMYNFMQRTQNGFTFITKDPDVDMDLIDGWDCMEKDGVWPDGNNTTLDYEFSVLFKSKPIMEFSWCDYRGGAILERSSVSDVADLHKRIHDSGCLIICIGADTIKSILVGDDGKDRELVRLNNLLTRYTALQNRRVPIIFALTKADLYSLDEQKQLLGVIRQYFSALYVQGAGWLHAIVPVSLGTFNSQFSEGKHIDGVIAPKNIHVPVMFFLHSILKERAREIQNRLQGISTNRDNYRQEILKNAKRSGWDKFWNGDNTNTLSSQISSLNEEEKNITQKLSDLEAVFSNMSEMFNVCKIYYDGQPIDF